MIGLVTPSRIGLELLAARSEFPVNGWSSIGRQDESVKSSNANFLPMTEPRRSLPQRFFQTSITHPIVPSKEADFTGLAGNDIDRDSKSVTLCLSPWHFHVRSDDPASAPTHENPGGRRLFLSATRSTMRFVRFSRWERAFCH